MTVAKLGAVLSLLPVLTIGVGTGEAAAQPTRYPSAAEVCGDGTCDTGEDVFTCPEDCPPVCGNGVLEPGEECDDGGTVSGDGCSATCAIEVFCGNGACETIAGETVFTCPEDCLPVCGNGVLEPGEECDDGGTTSGDGCSATCTHEILCGNGACETIAGETVFTCPEDCPPVCGNGVLEPGEECDDGNTAAGDPCTPACETDTDVDAVPDSVDNCPLLANPAQTDLDLDGRGDSCDNCPDTLNPWQIDQDGDAAGEECDCAVLDPAAWRPPSEVRALEFTTTKTVVHWTPPSDLGGTTGVSYDTLRSTDPSDFMTIPATICVESDDPADTQAVDGTTPGSGVVFHYLIRAENGCPNPGSLGSASSSTPRTGRDCP